MHGQSQLQSQPWHCYTSTSSLNYLIAVRHKVKSVAAASLLHQCLLFKYLPPFGGILKGLKHSCCYFCTRTWKAGLKLLGAAAFAASAQRIHAVVGKVDLGVFTIKALGIQVDMPLPGHLDERWGCTVLWCTVVSYEKGGPKPRRDILLSEVLRVFSAGNKRGQFAEQVSSHTYLAVLVNTKVLKSHWEHTKIFSHIKMHVSDGPGRGNVNLLDSWKEIGKDRKGLVRKWVKMVVGKDWRYQAYFHLRAEDLLLPFMH